MNVGIVTKDIRDIYLDCASVLRAIKKWFGRFQNGDLILDRFCIYDQLRSERPLGIDDDVVRTLVEYNSISVFFFFLFCKQYHLRAALRRNLSGFL